MFYISTTVLEYTSLVLSSIILIASNKPVAIDTGI